MEAIHYITNETGQRTGIIINFQDTKVENFTDTFLTDLQSLVYKYLNENLDSTKIVAYTIDRKPITKKEFANHILSLSENVKKGTAKTYSQQEVDNLIETW